LEDKDANIIIIACNNIQMTVDPPIKLPFHLDTWVPPLPKTDKGEPLFEQVENHGNWQEYTYTAKPSYKKEDKHIIVSPQE
jgi:hypothetical protein